MKYNWEFKKWPEFKYTAEKIRDASISFAEEFGVVNGMLLGITKELKQETMLEILIAEAIKTSEIEGEYMSREDVMSSIKKNLGMYSSIHIKDKRALGVAELMVELNRDISRALSEDMICHWHQILMQHHPTVNPGKWRKGNEPMQIISGTYGKEVVHFEAPPSHVLPVEMQKFISWFNECSLPVADNISKAMLKSAIAHLYFESIHPFEDGNGRIGRALAEYTLSHTLKIPILLSLSKAIEKDRNLYYSQLKIAQRSLEITDWIVYFCGIILEAQRDTKALVEFTLKKSNFFDVFSKQLNERQLKVINRMLENGTAGFEGGMTAKKYMAIAKTSKATATRDLQQLHELGVVRQEGAGRSVRYQLEMNEIHSEK